MAGEVYQAQFLTVHASILEHIVRTQIRSPRQGNKADKPCIHPDCPDVSVVNIKDYTTSPVKISGHPLC